jgi:pSer/pThr/pTyr-binding forkhead associated (FHA) protein
VSRMHAGLRRQGDTLVLTDLGSLNYTFINGQRVHPHEVRILRNGDELRIGQLKMRVYFRNE